MLNAPKNPVTSKNEIRALRKHRRWRVIVFAGIAAAVAALLAPTRNEALAPPANSVALVAAVPPSEWPAALPARQSIGRAHVDLFAPRSWEPPPRPPRLQSTEPPPSPPPSAPPLPYRFAGTIGYGGSLKAVLAIGDRIQDVKVGDVVDDLYQVHAVSRDGATLFYIPLGVEQQIVHVPGAPAQTAVLQQMHAAPRAPSPFPPGPPLATR